LSRSSKYVLFSGIEVVCTSSEGGQNSSFGTAEETGEMSQNWRRKNYML